MIGHAPERLDTASEAPPTGRPLIGVSTSELRPGETLRPIPEGEPVRRELALGLNYVRAVEAAGAVPMVVPPLGLAAVEPVIEHLSGLVLSGGPDLEPAVYGGMPHSELGPTEPELDVFELALTRRADALGLPVLAICRGVQVLNVARGGSLLQHLPDLGGAVEHRQTEPSDWPTHAVAVEPDSLLARVLGTSRARVNSFHHQAPDEIGAGLRVVARSPDGVVEGLEDPERDFLVGVQWHAEGLTRRPEQRALFAAFVAAAKRQDAAGADGRGP